MARNADGVFMQKGGAAPVSHVAQVAIFAIVTADGNRILPFEAGCC